MILNIEYIEYTEDKFLFFMKKKFLDLLSINLIFSLNKSQRLRKK